MVTCVRKLSSVHYRNLLDFLCPAALLCQQISEQFKSPVRTRKPGNVNVRLVQLSEAGLINFFLIRGSISDTHHNIVYVDLLSNPNP